MGTPVSIFESLRVPCTQSSLGHFHRAHNSSVHTVAAVADVALLIYCVLVSSLRCLECLDIPLCAQKALLCMLCKRRMMTRSLKTLRAYVADILPGASVAGGKEGSERLKHKCPRLRTPPSIFVAAHGSTWTVTTWPRVAAISVFW